MKYASGDIVIVGDVVQFDPNSAGSVVCDLENMTSDGSVDLNEWSYLEKGVLFRTELYGLVHLVEIDPDIRLVSRKMVG